MKRSILATTLATAMVAFGLTHTAPTAGEPPQPTADELQKAGQMNNGFAVDLYSQLNAKLGNLFFSPASIQTALAMTMAGARGETATQMAATLHVNASAQEQLGHFITRLNADGLKGGYELSMANALWGLKGFPFLPNYLQLVEKTYQGHLREMNFVSDPQGARKIINDWVATQTHDKIQNLLPPDSVNAATRLVLTNAIYFKGTWQHSFQKRLTQPDDFVISDGSKVGASMMHQQARFQYAENADLQALDLPYGNGDLSMRIYLPRRPGALPDLEKVMIKNPASFLKADMTYQDVVVSLPKFKIESEFSLGETLKKMGMTLAFDAEKADFKGMTTADQISISEVVHKAYVNTDEEGTEAAAATGVIMTMTAMAPSPVKPKEFRADHPFLFTIVHRSTGAVLFMGRVEKP